MALYTSEEYVRPAAVPKRLEREMVVVCGSTKLTMHPREFIGIFYFKVRAIIPRYNDVSQFENCLATGLDSMNSVGAARCRTDIQTLLRRFWHLRASKTCRADIHRSFWPCNIAGRRARVLSHDDGKPVRVHKGMGLVSQVLNGESCTDCRQDGPGPHALFDDRSSQVPQRPSAFAIG